jgi:hypothetical protein
VLEQRRTVGLAFGDALAFIHDVGSFQKKV